MKCKVNVSHLHIEKHDEQGNIIKVDGKPVEETHRKGSIIDLPLERIKRLGNSVSLLDDPAIVQVPAGSLPPETLVKVERRVIGTMTSKGEFTPTPKTEQTPKEPAGDKQPNKAETKTPGGKK